MDAQERESIRRIADGDFSAMDALYQRYAYAVKTWAFNQVREDGLAEDITQKTFVELYRAVTETPGLAEECESVRGLLKTFADRIVTDNRRYASRQKEVLEEYARQPSIAPERPDEIYDANETTEEVQEAVDDLSPALRLSTELHYFHELTPKEISELTGIPIATTRSHLYRSKKILAGRLRHHLKRKQQ